MKPWVLPVVKDRSIRRETSMVACLEAAILLLSKLRPAEPVACWEREELVFLWSLKNIWRSSFRVLLWMWEDGQGVLCLVDAAFASLNLHFLSFLSPLLLFFPPTPIYYSVSVFSCSFARVDLRLSPFGFWCCPYSLKFLWRQFSPLFSKCVDIHSISSLTKKKKNVVKKKSEPDFLKLSKTSVERRENVQVSSYFYLSSFPIQIVSIRNVRRFRGIQSWSWIIQIYIKNAELLEQPVHFTENIGKTLGNENKYHLFLSFLLKGQTKRKKSQL